ncbi:MAG: acyl-CoA dehydrogenase family protein [Microthrixaceae bacterium]|nr:acyl-CoA dehydrogenase family protein [Microthrixaceae bacterium]
MRTASRRRSCARWGGELDRMVDPAEVIAEGSPLWDAFRRYRELGFGAIAQDESLDPLVRARLGCIVNEELSWGDVGLAISLGLSQFHPPFVEMSGDSELVERFCDPATTHDRVLGAHRTRPRQRHGRRPRTRTSRTASGGRTASPVPTVPTS